MIGCKKYTMAKTLKGQKFKTFEKDAKNAPVKNIEWEGEEVYAESDTKLEHDEGKGEPVIIRSFEFGVNPKAFKEHTPTKQELFNSHLRGMESLLWRDGLKPFEGVEPRLIFSKNRRQYRIIVACQPSRGNVLLETPQRLSELIKK